jgi:signal transduction histidine kinase
VSDNKEFESKKITYTLTFVWLFIVTLSLFISVFLEVEKTEEIIKSMAESTFGRDRAYRLWATHHGGVYVPVTSTTRPNEKLNNIKERDITTPSGRKLTLMNPAYMMRQFYKRFSHLSEIHGHITSLKLKNEINKPDSWEKEALSAFEDGASHYEGYQESKGVTYFRYMEPLSTSKGCLKCHEEDGYKEGDVRGGVSVKVNVDKLSATSNEIVLFLVLGHIAMALLGAYFIISSIRRLKSIHNEGLKLQEEKIALQEKLINITRARVDDIEKMVKITSHDLRVPLFNIEGFSHELQNLSNLTHDNSKEIDEFTEVIDKNVSLINSIVTSINSYCKDVEKIELELVDVNLVAKSVIKSLEPQIKAVGSVVIDLRVLPKVTADVKLLERAFMNLIGNSIKYRALKRDLKIEISSVEDSENYIFSVKDNGIGVAPDQHAKVFDMFYRTRDAADMVDGDGIGLCIVKKIITELEGAVWIESELNAGCNVKFSLPK